MIYSLKPSHIVIFVCTFLLSRKFIFLQEN